MEVVSWSSFMLLLSGGGRDDRWEQASVAITPPRAWGICTSCTPLPLMKGKGEREND